MFTTFKLLKLIFISAKLRSLSIAYEYFIPLCNLAVVFVSVYE